MANQEIAAQQPTETSVQNNTVNDDLRERLQNFLSLLNKQPKPESLGETPDKKAKTVLISHVEMTLDEYFFGMWKTTNFRWSQVGNEVVGAISLSVLHPVSGLWIEREGAASIVIMVDRAPDNIQGRERNLWALDMENKKSNALDMGFPKLKAECLKNAANSLGALFGRDLNRKEKDRDTFTPLFRMKPKTTNNEPANNNTAAN